MRCNIFKPLSNDAGEFLMFSQYADDLTREDPGKGSYRVVPSRFAALRLNLDQFLNHISESDKELMDGEESEDANIVALNRNLSRYLQSYYENMVCTVKESLGKLEDPDNTFNEEMYWDLDFDPDPQTESTTRTPLDGYAGQMLWSFLEDTGLITYTPADTNVGTDENPMITPYGTFPELKFIGDINIHSDRMADGMHYNDIYCYISPTDDSYWYKTEQIEGFWNGANKEKIFPLLDEECILGWTHASYPPNNGGIGVDPRPVSASYYNIGEHHKIVFPEDSPSQPERRHQDGDKNIAWDFNCIIVFYDIVHDLGLEDGPVLLHKNRPLGIYFTGAAASETNPQDMNASDDDGMGQRLRGQVTKYVSHEDIFSQGSGWSVRLMTRVVVTPNASSYTFFVDGGDDYGTMAGALGSIAEAIADIRTDMRLQAQNYQLMKDHLAMFKNYRTNIPYVRNVLGIDYWFVNGRNTGQRVYLPEPVVYEFRSYDSTGVTQYGTGTVVVVESMNQYSIVRILSNDADDSWIGRYVRVNTSNIIDPEELLPLKDVDGNDLGISIRANKLPLS